MFYKLLCNGQLRLTNKANVVLQNTLLGCIVTGEVDEPSYKPSPRACHLVTSLASLLPSLSRFWEVEEVPDKKYLSADEARCENIYASTTKRGADGRYTVRLPFNDKRNAKKK